MVYKLKNQEYCDLCGEESENFKLLVSEVPSPGSVLYKLGVTTSYKTVMCESCGWVFKPGILSPSQLNELYAAHGGEATLNKNCEKVSHIRSDQLFKWVNEIEPINKELSVLDVGGGVGQATSAFAEKHHKVTVLDMAGGELVNENMELVKSEYYDFNPEKHYDIIFMNHVAEHVWGPTKLFTHSHSLLLDTGYLYVEVPFELITPFIKNKLGDPCHVGYFSIRTLRCFFEKCGFEIVKIERSLGWYNDRRVMILKAVAKKQKPTQDGRITNDEIKINNANSVALEIFSLSQLAVTFRFLLHRLTKKYFL